MGAGQSPVQQRPSSHSFELGGRGDAEPNVVVAVRRRVVVAVSGTAVLRVVVPTAAAQHTVRALYSAIDLFITVRKSVCVSAY